MNCKRILTQWTNSGGWDIAQMESEVLEGLSDREFGKG